MNILFINSKNSKEQNCVDWPERLRKSAKAARADTRDVTIDAQIQRNVDAEQTNVAAGNGSIST